MISMPRSKYHGQKIQRSTATTLKSCNSNFSNPEIDCLVLKLNALTDQFDSNLQNPLNLMEWKRTKYWPTQSQNRLRIQNEVSFKKADKIAVRPRVKPISRQSKSMQINRQYSLPYKDHYQKIVEEFRWKQDDYQSQEEQQRPMPVPVSAPITPKKFRFYDSVKKYRKATSFIESKISENKEIKLNSKIKTKTQQAYSSYKQNSVNSDKSTQKKKKLSKTRAMINFSDEQSLLKIDSIVRKWKPCQIVEKKFVQSDVNKYKPKRYSMKNVNLPSQLPLQTPRDTRTPTSAPQSPTKSPIKHRASQLITK